PPLLLRTSPPPRTSRAALPLPTRRSSDLFAGRPPGDRASRPTAGSASRPTAGSAAEEEPQTVAVNATLPACPAEEVESVLARKRDRKSTRLNSSHVSSSYAVFCLKNKKT